jgi:hypothetical protein
MRERRWSARLESFFGDGFNAVDPTCAQDEFATLAREGERSGRSEAARSPGDQNPSIRQRVWHGHVL